MSNSTSRVFHGIPHEKGTRGETMSLPTVQDYLKEICKEDNVDVDQYLANHTVKTLDTSLFTNLKPVEITTPKNYGISYRVFSVWLTLKNIKHSGYNPFDFCNLPEFNTHDFDVATGTSKPWGRFKNFIKNQWWEIKWAWNYKP
jgi:hypothetical protein